MSVWRKCSCTAPSIFLENAQSKAHPSKRVRTDDFPAVALAEFVAFIVVDRPGGRPTNTRRALPEHRKRPLISVSRGISAAQHRYRLVPSWFQPAALYRDIPGWTRQLVRSKRSALERENLHLRSSKDGGGDAGLTARVDHSGGLMADHLRSVEIDPVGIALGFQP
jgi:hypothetical protein